MIAKLGTWKIGINPAKPLGYDIVRTYFWEAPIPFPERHRTGAPSPPDRSGLDPLEAAGDFIARQVLDKDSVFFEG